MKKAPLKKWNVEPQIIWNILRKINAPTTFPEIIKQSKLSQGVVIGIVGRMRLAGLVSIDKTTKPHIIKIVKNVGSICPNLDDSGNRRPPSDEDKMWMSIKALKEFTPRDLSLASQTFERTCRRYAEALAQAGYLIRTHVVSGELKKRTEPRFRFKNSSDTGPLSPMVCRGDVFDRNRNKVVWGKSLNQGGLNELSK